jgi:YegS/Rv2252/BmrU family lipid kinase
MQKRWREVEQVLRAENFEYDAVFTERKGHATELARAALVAGYDLIVVVGGDGTTYEVVNGMFGADGKPLNPNVALGIITSGTGADFVRSAGIPGDIIASAQQLARAQTTRPIDIGEIIYRVDGTETRRYFANVAGMGFDAEVIERTERGGKHAGGTIPYLTTLLGTISSYKNKNVIAQIDDRRIESRVNSVIVCNGKYFGGGMMISPNSKIDDGKFQVIILGNFGTIEVMLNTPRLYNGTILTHPKVSEYHATTVHVESKQRMLIQADGELVGPGPATFRIHPGALKLRC